MKLTTTPLTDPLNIDHLTDAEQAEWARLGAIVDELHPVPGCCSTCDRADDLLGIAMACDAGYAAPLLAEVADLLGA